MEDIFKTLDEKKKLLDNHRPLPPERVANLKAVFDLDLTYNSNAIEGNTLSFAETRLVLREGITIGGKTLREHLEVINHKEAIDFVEGLAGKASGEITESDILKVHALILRQIDRDNAGRYRNLHVHVLRADGETHGFCEPWMVPKMMEDFFLWLGNEEGMHPVRLAAEAHFRLVSIHPFIDGNGRVARLLMNLILQQHGLPPAVVRVANRKEYLDSIVEAETSGDPAAFVRIIARAVDKSLDLYLEAIEGNVVYK
ncbi:MAG: Fic family protein [Desulfatibacillaceae bacterium]